MKALAEILRVVPVAENHFVGHSPPTSWWRVFGGLVVAQALAAAAHTVPDRALHSLHAYFILGGDPAVPIHYAVERLRDGASFSTRRCVASQNDKAIFALSASFHKEEAGWSHQAVMPNVPPPQDLLSEAQLADRFAGVMPENVRQFLRQERPIELRPTDLTRFYGTRLAQPQVAVQNIWVRAKAPLGDDPALHRIALAYMSDMTLLDAALIAHGRSVFDPAVQVASLDHALWFHRPFRADEWLLYSQESPTSSGALGLSRGLFFRQTGELVASVVQEGLIRERRPQALR